MSTQESGLSQESLAALERIRLQNPAADPLTSLPDVDPARIPRHIAIIMDGNGRWASQKGFPREFGHRNGAAAVRRTVAEAGRCGVQHITLYSFSTENWSRPRAEVDALMKLCEAYCEGERDELIRQGIRVRVIGTRDGLPGSVLDALDELVRVTHESSQSGPTLCLAINYGAREEITDAVRRIAHAVERDELSPDAIDENLIADHLYTGGIPDPDLLIRTAGEMRLSNYLLWQLSYAEIYVTQTLWPDFDEASLREAIREYAGRSRRFGGLEDR